MEEFDFDNLVDDMVHSMQYVSSQRLKQTGRTGKKVKGDRERIGQVIINFISNAIKFSPEKSAIAVTTSTEKNEVTLSVSDHGIGITREDQARVFDRFSEINSESKRSKGLGIGLFISSQIINRQNGRIWVESEKGKGSTFSFSLPAE
jgi:signal transduction histidine kinase